MTAWEKGTPVLGFSHAPQYATEGNFAEAIGGFHPILGYLLWFKNSKHQVEIDFKENQLNEMSNLTRFCLQWLRLKHP